MSFSFTNAFKTFYTLAFGLLQLVIILLIARLLGNYVPLPTSILGLIICCLYCLALGGIPPSLEAAGGLLLKYMPLFFIPLVVGIPIFWSELNNVWLICLLALIISTVLSMVVTAKLADRNLDKQD